MKRVLVVVLIFCLCVSACPLAVHADAPDGVERTDSRTEESPVPGVNGLADLGDGWKYYVDGQVDTSYTGLAENEYGWWYVFNGSLDLNYTGLATNENGTFYIYKGQLADWRTGCEWVNGEYCEFYNGQLTTWKTDAWVVNPSGDGQTWVAMRCGKVSPAYTGIAENENGVWYLTNGTLDFSFTGLAENPYGIWYVYKGQVADWRTGCEWVNGEYCEFYKGQLTTWKTDATLVNPSGDGQTWVAMRCGKVDPTYTGLAENENGWWYVFDGQMDFTFTGLVTNAYGTWYVYLGQLTTWIEDWARIDGTIYKVYKGQLCEWESGTYDFYGTPVIVENGVVTGPAPAVTPAPSPTPRVEPPSPVVPTPTPTPKPTATPAPTPTPHVHGWGSWTDVTAPTCTASGTQKRTCWCGASETRTVDALGHNWTTESVTEQGHWESQITGYTDGDPLYEWQDVWVGSYAVCNACGQQFTDGWSLSSHQIEAGHNGDHSAPRYESQYVLVGYEQVPVYGDVWVIDTPASTRTYCTRCGLEQ